MKKREIVKRSKIYSIVYISLMITILLLSIGFSSYSETLALNGGAMLRPNLNARITDVGINNVKNGGLVNSNAEFAAYTLLSDITLPNSNSTVTFNITVANLYSDNLVITDVNKVAYTNNNIEYTFQNLEINETKIPPASVYTFQITFKFKDGASVSNTDLSSILEFTFRRVPQYTFEINAVPSGCTIEMTAGGNTYTSSNSSLSHAFEEGTTVTWKVSKLDYYEQTGSQTLNRDVTKNITLEEMPYGTLTINPTPSDSTVEIKQGNIVLASGTGSQTVKLLEGNAVTYTVTREDYYDTSGSYTMVKGAKTTNVTLEEIPWITGTFMNTNSTTPFSTKPVNYHEGYYLIEIWSGAGGANGGGAAGTDRTYPGGGGGGLSAFGLCDIISEGNIDNGTIKFLVGGGGGGGGNASSSSAGGNGGAGGTFSNASTAISTGIVFHGSDGTTAKSRGQGYGGTTSNGTAGGSASAGTKFLGGAGNSRGGGGGCGYYGGGGGGYSSSYGPGGGGGGSSFIANDVQYTNLSSDITSKLLGTNPSSTGGAAVITFLGKSLD